MRIVWTKKAEKHLTQIYNYIALDSPFYATRSIERIVEKAESVSEFPNKGRIVPEYQNDNIREVFLHPYRIIYHIRDRQILIISVLHQARDLTKFREENS